MKRSNRSQRGLVTVESALSMAFFFVAFFSAIDLIVAGYRAVALQYTVMRTMRWAVLNEDVEDPNDPGTFLTRERAIEWKMLQNGALYGLDLGTPTYVPGNDHPHISVCAESAPNFPDCTSDQAGLSGDLIQLEARQAYKILFFWFDFTSSALGKAEPFN